jgi:transposase
VPPSPTEERKTIAAHTRRAGPRETATGEELKFFDESKVPVQTIVLVHADLEGLSPDEYEVIGEKVTYRLAQRPGSYQVLKYRRPVIKLKRDQRILCLPAPEGILEGSRADVSFAAGLLIDKFAWHLPLYRQHQRLEAAGITVSRPWLTQVAQRSIGLLEPIYEAQFASVRSSRVKAMDETPIKAGRSGHGKMQTGYFWPVYGELDEVCFPFHPSRSHDYVSRALALSGEAKQRHRLTHSKPIVAGFFDWIDHQLRRQGLTPANPLTKALDYARERRAGLEVFLTDPEVPIDTNHLERALRVIPMGRKSWLFCWTELGARHVGHRAEPDRHLPPARRRSLHLPRRRPAARRRAPGHARRRTHPTPVEAALRRPADALRPQRLPAVGKDAA